MRGVTVQARVEIGAFMFLDVAGFQDGVVTIETERAFVISQKNRLL